MFIFCQKLPMVQLGVAAPEPTKPNRGQTNV